MAPSNSQREQSSTGSGNGRRGLWWRIVPLCLVAVLLLAACGAGDAGAAQSFALRPPDTKTITEHVTASVLITSDPSMSDEEIASVRVSPNSVVLDPGESTTLVAQGIAADGRPIEGVDFVWTIADLRSGTVSEDGVMTAGLAPGVFGDAITVTGVQNAAQGIRYASSQVAVTVVGEQLAPKIASLAILPDSPSVLSRQIYRFRAAAFDERGLVIPGVAFDWRVNDPGLGRVNEIGYLTVEGDPGTFEDVVTVTAFWEGVQISETTDVTILRTPREDDFLKVQILPQRFLLDPGDRLKLRAVALNGLGEMVSGTQLRWIVSDPQAGTVDGKGLFVAGDTPGVYTEAIRVQAVVPGERGIARAEDFASVVVRTDDAPRRLANVSVLPGAVIVAPGGNVLLSAHGVDDFGRPAAKVQVNWESVEPNAGRIDANGAFTATDIPGVYKGALKVTVEQPQDGEVISASKLVDVSVTGAMTRLEVRPTLATVSPGRTIHFRLSGWDENELKLPGLLVRWTVSNDDIGSIDAFGNFTAGDRPGIYTDAIQAEVIQTLPNTVP